MTSYLVMQKEPIKILHSWEMAESFSEQLQTLTGVFVERELLKIPSNKFVSAEDDKRSGWWEFQSAVQYTYLRSPEIVCSPPRAPQWAVLWQPWSENVIPLFSHSTLMWESNSAFCLICYALSGWIWTLMNISMKMVIAWWHANIDNISQYVWVILASSNLKHTSNHVEHPSQEVRKKVTYSPFLSW